MWSGSIMRSWRGAHACASASVDGVEWTRVSDRVDGVEAESDSGNADWSREYEDHSPLRRPRAVVRDEAPSERPRSGPPRVRATRPGEGAPARRRRHQVDRGPPAGSRCTPAAAAASRRAGARGAAASRAAPRVPRRAGKPAFPPTSACAGGVRAGTVQAQSHNHVGAPVRRTLSAKDMCGSIPK